MCVAPTYMGYDLGSGGGQYVLMEADGMVWALRIDRCFG